MSVSPSQPPEYKVLDTSTPISIQKILVATDFSPVTEAGVLFALGIARRNGAEVFIVSVVPESYQLLSQEAQERAMNDAWREARRLMTDHFIAGRLDGVRHQLMIERGDVWDRLSKIIDDKHIDMLVIGTRGRSRVGKLFLGSVAETIFRQASCPVLTIGPKSRREALPDGPKNILFCTGFSGHSLRAGSYALWMARRISAHLSVLYVHSQAPRGKEERAKQTEEFKARLRALVPTNHELPDEPSILVEYGTPRDKIIEVAKKQKADLIVLGVRQPEGFARRLRWATAYEVVSKATCPVLTVRSQITE